MSLKPPFGNLYQCKHVAENVNRACVLCYKPTATVLITLNQKDWFYVCDLHLKDKQFADLVYRDRDGKDTTSAKTTLNTNITNKKQELDKYERIKAEKSQNGWFDKMGGIWKSGKDKLDLKDEPEKEKDLIPELKKVLEQAQLELKSFEKLNIKYKLDPIFYKRRLMEDYQKQKQKETLKKMEEGTLFPSFGSMNELK